MKLTYISESKKKWDAVVAVDLDGTLARYDGKFSKKIGEPIHNAREILAKLQALNVCIVINTCRGDKDAVKEWLQKHDIPFNFINEFPDQPKDTSHKIMADRYWDDRQPSWRGLQYAYDELVRYLHRNK